MEIILIAIIKSFENFRRVVEIIVASNLASNIRHKITNLSAWIVHEIKYLSTISASPFLIEKCSFILERGAGFGNLVTIWGELQQMFVIHVLQFFKLFKYFSSNALIKYCKCVKKKTCSAK